VNLLLEVLASLLDARLTITGDGPEKKHLQEQVRLLGLSQRVTFHPSMHGDAKKILFAEHDLLILPSVTEISPNVALEAVSAGLPVLLSASTGLSEDRSRGMFRAPMDSATMILTALMHVQSTYTALQSEALLTRPWSVVTDEWVTLLHRV
jgi:glycosyltransferase involved in cell wall biosynthesis